jgi:hypothetical protein
MTVAAWLVLASASIVGALRCLADRLLPSALIYTVVAVALLAGAARAAVDTF